jgi:dTDP-4-amino-4,6-dideoxygalactose transaminase
MSSPRLAIDGGPPVRSTVLPLVGPLVDAAEAEAVAAAVTSGALIGAGKLGLAVEAQLAGLLGVERALLVNSCTAALEAAVLLANVGPGDDVVLPSFTFVSCANAVVRAGGRPVFADIDPHTFNVTPETLARAITPATRAVIVVHYAGRPCDMDGILALAAERGIRVIEDAAHALGATSRGRLLGTLGDFGCFSFHGSKDVVCGEGGALVCRHSADTDAAEILREKGTNRSAFFRGEVNKYEWVGLGGSLVVSDILAAMLQVQLGRLPAILARKRALAVRLTAALSDVSDRVALPPASAESSWHLYPVLVPQAHRDDVLAALKREGIGASFHYIPLHSSPYARSLAGYSPADLPVSTHVADSLVRLPIFPAITDTDIDDVVAATLKVVGRLLPSHAAAR